MIDECTFLDIVLWQTFFITFLFSNFLSVQINTACYVNLSESAPHPTHFYSYEWHILYILHIHLHAHTFIHSHAFLTHTSHNSHRNTHTHNLTSHMHSQIELYSILWWSTTNHCLQNFIFFFLYSWCTDSWCNSTVEISIISFHFKFIIILSM